jgi:hypothetical protein
MAITFPIRLQGYHREDYFERSFKQMPLCVIDGVMKIAFQCKSRTYRQIQFAKLTTWLHCALNQERWTSSRESWNSKWAKKFFVSKRFSSFEVFELIRNIENLELRHFGFGAFIVLIVGYLHLWFIHNYIQIFYYRASAQQSIMIRCCLTKLSSKLWDQTIETMVWLIHKQQQQSLG